MYKSGKTLILLGLFYLFFSHGLDLHAHTEETDVIYIEETEATDSGVEELKNNEAYHYEDEVDTDVSEESVEIEEEEIHIDSSQEAPEGHEANEANEALMPLTGNGTEQEPYTAGTAAELRSVLQTIRTDPGTGTYHILLTDNIFYNASDVFEIHKDVVIDGQGFHMLYANNASTAAGDTGFRIRVSGVQATVRNLNFGSDTLTDANGQVYDNNTYYGVLGSAGTDNIRFDAIFENVNYFARRGAQPLLTWNRQSRFIFKGENHFISRTGTNSQEFMEGYNITFAEGSKTTIDHQTEVNLGFIFAFGTGGSAGSDGRIRINVEENAEVNILSSKQHFTFGAQVIFTIAENAKFHYRQTANRALSFSNNQAVTVNIDPNTQATFLSNGQINSGNTVNFNVNEPDFIRFQNLSSSTGLFARNMNFNRLDSAGEATGGYNFYYMNQNQRLVRRGIPGASSRVLANNQFSHSGLRHAIYKKRTNFDLANTADVGIGRSKLTTTIDSYDPAGRLVTDVEYKLSKERLWSGASITETSAQTAIEQATENTPGMVATNKSTNLSWQNDELRAGTYYVYARVTTAISDDPEKLLFASDSFWQEKEVVIERSPIHVVVPLEKLFDVRETGEFYKDEHSQPIVSHSNFPIDFTVTHVADHSVDPTITLVDEIIEEGKDDLVLNLGVTNGQKLGPLLVGENKLDTVSLEPFLDEPLELFLKGEFRGSIFKKHQTDFRLTYILTAQGAED
ncbi:hypothetical protein [Candidatus Enterococcus mangumiae]|uniref:WxL domain-containing protein n=1 Tax=Candidatus Enterococcus mangumiae TaxID=2230878 RepID=A0ABZ2T3I9_9ENTE|nr:hypothetical protein [Enterococcus sp. DIV1094]MBO0489894.1 hypothetical protein [Enterococcus sp. DIV1094]